MRDLRDPIALGERLLGSRNHKIFDVYANGRLMPGIQVPLHYLADYISLRVEDYDANPGPLEKYGDPTKLPSTLPN